MVLKKFLNLAGQYILELCQLFESVRFTMDFGMDGTH